MDALHRHSPQDGGISELYDTVYTLKTGMVGRLLSFCSPAGQKRKIPLSWMPAGDRSECSGCSLAHAMTSSDVSKSAAEGHPPQPPKRGCKHCWHVAKSGRYPVSRKCTDPYR